MKVSAKINYACLALLELALNWPKTEPVPIALIAKNQKIPIRFLTHILVQLKSLGFVESVRGQRGGYTLSHPPKEITLRNVMEEFSEGHSKITRMTATKDIFSNIWREAQMHYLDYLQSMNFDEILSLHRKTGSEPMYFI